MGDTATRTDSLPATGQAASTATGTPAPETTKEQWQKLVSDAKAEAGRYKKEAETLRTETATLKSQVSAKEGELSDIGEERERLHKEIDDLASGDPERFSLVKRDRELREKERNLKTGIAALEAEKITHGARLSKADAIDRDVLILEVAEDYRDADSQKLTNLCELAGAKTEDAIRKIADTLWVKAAGNAPPVTAMTPDSGRTSGGTESLQGKSREELGRMAYSRRK